MSRWGFGRRPTKGRHALGAAVTELPSAPVRVAPAPVLMIAPATAQPKVPADEAVPELPSYPAPADGPAALSRYLELSDAELEWLGLLDPEPPPGEQTADEVVPEEPAPVAPAPAKAPFALDPLDAAVPLASLPVAPEYADLLVPEQAVARVSLGFRDGTTTSLAADSVQAMALEELASLLTQRD